MYKEGKLGKRSRQWNEQGQWRSRPPPLHPTPSPSPSPSPWPSPWPSPAPPPPPPSQNHQAGFRSSPKTLFLCHSSLRVAILATCSSWIPGIVTLTTPPFPGTRRCIPTLLRPMGTIASLLSPTPSRAFVSFPPLFSLIAPASFSFFLLALLMKCL